MPMLGVRLLSPMEWPQPCSFAFRTVSHSTPIDSFILTCYLCFSHLHKDIVWKDLHGFHLPGKEVPLHPQQGHVSTHYRELLTRLALVPTLMASIISLGVPLWQVLLALLAQLVRPIGTFVPAVSQRLMLISCMYYYTCLFSCRLDGNHGINNLWLLN